jgi:hypothetical protein
MDDRQQYLQRTVQQTIKRVTTIVLNVVLFLHCTYNKLRPRIKYVHTVIPNQTNNQFQHFMKINDTNKSH